MFKLEHYLEQQKTRVDLALAQALPKNTPEALLEAMQYSLLAGGKRLRPILCLAAAQACGKKESLVMPAACAIEMVHTYSLIHDDLPCMDDDDFRRGRLTCHKVFGENMAVLAGDALLTLGFEILAASNASLSQDRLLKAVAILARAAGAQGMVGGQVLDLQGENKTLDQTALETIHQLKTGALIEGALKIGAVLADAEVREIGALAAYGQAFGLAFQITDDILDVTGNPEKMGKATGRDAKQHKSTYVTKNGVEEARKLAETAICQAQKQLEFLSGDTRPLWHLADYLIQRES